MPTPGQIAEVAKHYVIAMIWADCPEGTHPRATHRTHAEAFNRCKAFIDRHLELFNLAMHCAERGYGAHPDAGSAEAAFGHDLYLSTAGHGAGFFDRTELPKGLRDALQEAARREPDPEPEFWRGWVYLRPPFQPDSSPVEASE